MAVQVLNRDQIAFYLFAARIRRGGAVGSGEKPIVIVPASKPELCSWQNETF